MADFEVPWVISKSKHSARLFRRTLQQQLGTGSGVSRPGDLKVLPLNTPGDGFRVMPGGGIAQSRDTSASARESYGPILPAQKTVTDVPGTGSGSGRRDLVILEITDPEMETNTYPAPADPEYTGGWLDGDNFNRITIIQDVDSLVPVDQRPVKSLDQITTGDYANVTGVTLAAITYPPSTATITTGMIEDLRKVQSPRSMRVLRAINLSDLQRLSNTTAPPAGGQTFPNEFTGDAGKISIPDWATRARIVMTWGSVKFVGAASGYMWVQVGQNVDPDVFRTQVGSFDSSGGDRDTWIVADTKTIPAGMRGTDKWFFPRASLGAAIPTESNRPYVNASSSIVLDVEFFEDAV